MLVLTRKPNQSIRLGPDIRITVVRVSRDRVRLGIEAPRELPIIREELLIPQTDLSAAKGVISSAESGG